MSSLGRYVATRLNSSAKAARALPISNPLTRTGSLCHVKRSFNSSASLQAKNKTKKGDTAALTSSVLGDTTGFDKSTLEQSCTSTLSKLQKELQDLKSGRQDPNILNHLKIPSENTILSTLATVSQKNPKTFLVTVYDPIHVKHVSSAIAGSNQNFNPQPVPNNPTQLTINIPKDSSSARAEKVKVIGQKTEQAKVQIRHHRGDALKVIKKSESSKDERKQEEKEVQEVIERFGKEVDKLTETVKKDLGA